jgi:hypothetical protein
MAIALHCEQTESQRNMETSDTRWTGVDDRISGSIAEVRRLGNCIRAVKDARVIETQSEFIDETDG